LKFFQALLNKTKNLLIVKLKFYLKMKKVLLATVVVLFAISVNAQVQFGVKAGLNLANVSVTEGGESADTKMKPGFHIGAIVDLSLSESFSVQPGLLFSQKGTKSEGSYSQQGITVDTKSTMKLNYLDIPINAVLKLEAGSSKIHLFAGPVISYALSGKTTVEASAMGISNSEDADVEFGSEDGQMKRLDFGVNVGAGIQFNKILVSANYNLGLANLISGGDSDNFMKNRTIGISVAYLFGGK
jgi:hypothetical protein